MASQLSSFFLPTYFFFFLHFFEQFINVLMCQYANYHAAHSAAIGTLAYWHIGTLAYWHISTLAH
ncbi:hypothetical protein [uncultured Bacteroides sp.]|uniref:hypothetical protein n=1 Tax=uncultured Bacteroides sp. TaxID=162156 RepID=UPI00260054E5|nr:hypothetical protein [uncultured Bacteroides sp.]